MFLSPEVLDNVCKTIFLVYVRMQVPWKLQGAICENGFVNKNGAQRFCASAIGRVEFQVSWPYIDWHV